MIARMIEPGIWDGKTLYEVFEEHGVADPDSDLKTKMNIAIQEVMKMPIDGCITGSVWLDKYDPELWSSTPDIDVFVYSQNDLVAALVFAQYAMGMKPGTGSDRSQLQEETKIKILRKSGLNKKFGITTFKFSESGVVLNITFKMTRVNGVWKPLDSIFEVLRSFDMSIVMQGYDIASHSFIDLRKNMDPIAYPNPLRDHDCTTWTIQKWIRQFDRVVKYYERGYDTRPMAEFYINMIDECLKIGSIFDSDQSKLNFEECMSEFIEKRAAMVEWLEAHKDD